MGRRKNLSEEELLGRAMHNVDRLAAPLDHYQLPGFQLADICLDWGTSRLGAR